LRNATEAMNSPGALTLILTFLTLSLACQKPLNRNQPKGTPEMITKRESVADLLKTAGPFKLLYHVADIPASVRPVMVKSEQFDTTDMAEPGARFSSSDIRVQ